MRPLAFFRFSLVLPLVAPAIAWLVAKIVGSNQTTSFFVWSLLLGSVPYVMVLAVLWYISYKATLQRFMVWWRMSPFVMAFAFGGWILVVTLIGTGTLDWSTPGFLTAWFIGGIYCLLLGYAYIALAGLVYIFLERLGLIQEDHWLSAQPDA